MVQKQSRIVISILSGLIIAAQAFADAPPTTRPVGKELAAAQSKLKAIEAQLDKGFEDSPELKDAVDSVVQAQAACDAARTRIVASLSDNPDYQAALQQRAMAQQAFDQARQSNDSSQDQIANLAQQVMAARAAVMKIENDAMAADPSDAEKNLAAAKDALQQLRRKQHDSIKNDPNWKAAEKVLEEARATKATAPAVPAPTTSPTVTDRQFAETVLKLGGKLRLLADGNEAPWSELPLPDGNFAVIGAAFRDMKGIGDGQASVLRGASFLKQLDLFGTTIGDATVVGEIGRLSGLKDLNLAYTQISDRSMDVVGSLTNLISLDIGATQITDTGMIPVGKLIHLESLWVGLRPMTDRGLQPLSGLTELMFLDAERTDITDLHPISTMAQLQHLDIHGTQVTDDGLRPISELASLRWLDIGDGTKITDRGLATVGGLTNLTYLSLNGDQVTDRGVKSLSGLTNLKTLVVRDTILSDAAIHEVLPNCEIQR
jgi:Leucine-rich repeat (LRR) protein